MGKIVVDLPGTVGIDFAQALQAKLVEKATSNWEFMFGLLQRYAAREGTALVPAAHIEDAGPLGNWVSTQRQFRRTGRLSEGRGNRLEGLPGWSWAPIDEDWEKAFTALTRLLDEGHRRFGQRYEADGIKLGRWINHQRNFYAKGYLPADRIAPA